MCGIKGSGCDDDEEKGDSPTTSPTQIFDRVEENLLTSPFQFVDLVNGQWSIERSFLYELTPVIECPINGTVVFHYPNATHDVVRMASASHYDSCNFNDAIELSPASTPEEDTTNNKSYEYVTYYHHCSTPGALEYISCSIPGHCEAGQKIAIQTSETVDVYEEDSMSMALHVDKLSRILTVMGYTAQPGTGFVEMPLGYQTEEIAEKTMEWIWYVGFRVTKCYVNQRLSHPILFIPNRCGMDHCPDFYDLGDGLNDDEKESDCIGSTNLLLGFIERNKPSPDFDKSEEYYDIAIEAGGTNECAARSYKSKMLIDKGDFEQATVVAEELCQVCGNGAFDDIYGTAVRQAKSEFQAIGADVVEWPCADPLSGSASRSDGLLSLVFLFLHFLLF